MLNFVELRKVNVPSHCLNSLAFSGKENFRRVSVTKEEVTPVWTEQVCFVQKSSSPNVTLLHVTKFHLFATAFIETVCEKGTKKPLTFKYFSKKVA